MLTETETKRVWDSMIRAEVRSNYYAHMATRYTLTRKILSACLLFFSSGAAVSLGTKAPDWIPLAMSILSAAIAAYNISFDPAKSAEKMVKLHSLWNQLYAGYERLWNHWYDPEAEATLETLAKLGREASELGTEVPYNEQVLDTWRDRVYEQYTTNATP